jgi:Ulp1 family protease
MSHSFSLLDQSTRNMETDGTKDMEIEDTPPQQQCPQGPTSLHLPDSQDQPHKRARQHPPGSPNCASPKERAALVDYQYHVRDTMQDLKAVPLDVHPTIVDSFNIPISRRAFTSMAGGNFLNDDIINWMQTWWRKQIGGVV